MRNSKGQFIKGTLSTKPMLGKRHSEDTKRRMSEARRGIVFSKEYREKLSKAKMGVKMIYKNGHPKGMLGKIRTIESRRKQSESMKGFNAGPKHYRWNPDREAVKRNLRNDGAYLQFVKEVKKRDGNICQRKNENCEGYNIVHHIKSWALHIGLRYKITNGITLCQSHHPRTRDEELSFALSMN